MLVIEDHRVQFWENFVQSGVDGACETLYEHYMIYDEKLKFLPLDVKNNFGMKYIT